MSNVDFLKALCFSKTEFLKKNFELEINLYKENILEASEFQGTEIIEILCPRVQYLFHKC